MVEYSNMLLPHSLPSTQIEFCDTARGGRAALGLGPNFYIRLFIDSIAFSKQPENFWQFQK